MPSIVEISRLVLERKIFKLINVFSRFRYHLPLKEDRAVHLNKLDSPSAKDNFCQVWLKLTQWFWRRRVLQIVNVFLQFHYFLPLKKDRALHLNKLESPFPRDALCKVWLKLALWFFKFHQCIFAI